MMMMMMMILIYLRSSWRIMFNENSIRFSTEVVLVIDLLS